MRLEFFEEARFEMREAALFYESRQKSLGRRFRDEIAYVSRSITRHPLLWRERPGGYRRVNCPIFPCYIAYIIDRETIFVAAVAHGHREPEYWKHRLKE